MNHPSKSRPPRLCATLFALGFAFAGAASAGQFQFDSIVRAGLAGSGQWEIGAGGNTGDIAPYFVDGASYLFEAGYINGTNTAYTRVYADTNPASAYTEVTYNPSNGPSAGPGSVWTLPAASFFATAVPTMGFTAIRLSGLTVEGITSAINIIQPIQQTTLTAVQFFGMLAGTVTQSQDVIFQSDSSGSWRLRGVLQMWGLFSNGGTASGNQLEFGLTASVADTPEPASVGLALLGLSALFLAQRRGK